MRKFGVFSAAIFITVLLAGIYGIIHDQVTYSISPEYFTKFKYRQFGFTTEMFGGNRQTIAVIGFLATWWMGLFIGLIFALLGLLFKDHIIMKRSITKAIEIVFITAIAFAVFGFLYGKYKLVRTGVDWWLPEDLNDKSNFIIAGSIHNFSYIGGIGGLLIGVMFMIWKNLRLNQAA